MHKTIKENSKLITVILAFILLAFRGDGLAIIDGRNLWAEDGNIFFNQMASSGWESIFNPYAGYIHLYPRIAALFASFFDLNYLPIIFFTFWAISFLFCILTIYDWIYQKTESLWISSITVLIVSIFPHSGESFFNITNAHWFLSIALTIIIIDDKYKVSYKNFLILIILGLTGPFSILILPVLLLNILLKKDLKENLPKYLIIASTALIQIYFVYQSSRVGGEIDPNILNWLKNLYTFISFGVEDKLILLSITVWLIFSYFLVKSIYKKINKKASENQVNGILLTAALILIYFAGVWSLKQMPNILHPLGYGARYFVVPYFLFVISLPLLIKNKKILLATFSITIIISAFQFNKGPYFHKKDLNFYSYAWLSQYASNLYIPIHPQIEKHPGWHIYKENKNQSKNEHIYKIAIHDYKIVNGEQHENSLLALNNDLQLHLETPIQCFNSPHIGIELTVNRASNSWAQIFYADDQREFNDIDSLRLYYPEGEMTMQFAFKNNNIKKIRIDPTESNEKIVIKNLSVYCEKGQS